MLAYKIDETKPAYGIDLGFQRRHRSSHNDILVSRSPTATIDTNALFRKLADEWKRDTAHLSLISQRIQHPAYRRILTLGPSVVPLILKEMERQPDHWFHALVFLTGENPVPNDFTGTISDAVDLWIRWGRERHAA